MTAGLEFEVLPENCLKNEQLELVLGMPINQVIASLQNVSRQVKNVELEPFEKDITITLKKDGIRLYFEPKTQVLKLIEVFDFKNITLHYCNNVFSTPVDEANVSKVENCFGATHPGVYDEKQRLYSLHWRGISFSFPAKEPVSTIQPSYAHGLGSLNFPNSSLPLCDRMTIFNGNSPNDMKIPEIPITAHCGNVSLISIESLNENSDITGIQIEFLTEDESVLSPQKTSDLTRLQRSKLGAPSKIFYKSEEKMLIQRGSSSESLKNVDKPDFFFNYFTLGIDILFDSETRCVLKFILHTNIPGHFDFGIYSRCNFSIRVENRNANPLTLNTDSRLEEFISLFTSSDGDDDDNNSTNDHLSNGTSYGNNKPVILNKSSSASDGENPFGSTFCYGTDQLIVEVSIVFKTIIL